MAKADFEQIMKIGKVIQGLKAMSDILETKVTVDLPSEKKAQWDSLEKKYYDFYKLSFEERVVYAEIGKSHAS